MSLLDQTTTAVLKYATAVANSQSAGWREFLSTTGGNGFLGLTSADRSRLAIGSVEAPTNLAPPPAGGPIDAVADAGGNAALASGIAVVGEDLAKSGVGASAGKAGRAVAGTALAAFTGAGIPGFVLDLLVNLLWSAVAGGDAQKAAYDAARQATDQAFEVANAIRAGANEVLARWLGTHDRLQAVLSDTAISFAETKSLTDWLQSNLEALAPPQLDPKKLTSDLRLEWLQQHAGDEEDQNAETLGHAYDETRTKAKQPEEITNNKKLFIHQSKYAWGRLGLSLDKPVAQLTKALSAVETLDASAIAAKLSGTRVPLSEVQSPGLFARNLPGPGGMPLRQQVTEDLAAAVESRSFVLTCTLDLTDEDGTVFVNGFDYALTPKPGFDANEVARRGDVPQSGQIVPRSWSTSPD